MSLADFKILEKLGSGAYSSVYKVRRNLDNAIYALKKITFIGLSEKQKQNSLNEIRILASIRHENIIGYRQAFLDEQTRCLCIIMQYADDGDLYQKITKKATNKESFSQQEVWRLLIQVTKALKILHEKNILHRDLKSANVFLMKNGLVKLGDMNVSKILEKGLCQTQTGTPYYASPEVWKDQPYGQKSDVWSLGCVTYEMMSLHPPFQAEDMEGLYKKITKGIYDKAPSKFSVDLHDVIRLLLQTDPYKRPSCQKILKSKVVLKRLNSVNVKASQSGINPEFLETIRMPKDIYFLTEHLPKPNYFTPGKYQKNKLEASKTEKNHKKLDQIKYSIFPRVDKKDINGNKSLLIRNTSIIQAARSQLKQKEQTLIVRREKQRQKIKKNSKTQKNDQSLPSIKRKQRSILMSPHEKMEMIQKIYREPYSKKLQ